MCESASTVIVHKGIANNEYEIESILFDETFDSKTMYLVKWKNYPMDQCTWEPYRNLTNCSDILNKYNENKIKASNVYSTEAYKKLYEQLQFNTEQELIVALRGVIQNGMTPIDTGIIKGTIGYLSTIASNCRSPELMNVVKHNLKLSEVNKRRGKQIEKLEKWQSEMAEKCGFVLTVVNNVDFEGPPKKFLYMDTFIAGEGVVIPNDPPEWCECSDGMCGGKKRKRKGCHSSDHEVAYNHFKRIIVPAGSPVYECNSRCTCDSTCINRVVQHGPNKNLKLQIFRTDNHRGWGVKTLAPIKQGTYVNKYTGEVITTEEAVKRAGTCTQKSTYMFDLDFNSEQNDCVYSVDATNCGNVTHFINHSCDANLYIYAVWIDCLDPDLPTLAIFASRDIKSGEEITFNYKTSVSNTNRRIKCKCRSGNCRGYLS